ncbi:MAG: YARHG domain-containing protein [Prevotella sp.]|nr:YARHG domain-containing protein [Prevotella sp.]
MKLKTFTPAAIFMTTLQALAQTSDQPPKTGFEEMKEIIVGNGLRNREDELKERVTEILTQKNNRFAELKTENIATLLDNESFWTDGRVLVVFNPFYEETPPTLCIAPYRNDIVPVYDFPLPKTNGKQPIKQLVNKQHKTLQLVTTGTWKLLIIRDQQGRPEQVFTKINDQQAYNQITTFQLQDMHDVYDGRYRNSEGSDVFFGPKDFYEVDTWNTDPGLFGGIPDSEDGYTDIISYGDGRVSHGDPSSPNYGKMPGGGGAGAIMGPMVWAIRPSLNGIDAKILQDQPFVTHSPAIKKQETLQFVESPYGEDVPGQWAFASVRPIGRGMLFRYPKVLLRLMRNEIYARHGHRFTSAADVQRFFDAKPWYKPTNNPTPLSPIEQLNVQIIKAEEATRKNESTDIEAAGKPYGRLLNVSYNYQGMAMEMYSQFELSRDEKGKPQLSCRKFNEEVTWPVDESVFTAADSIITAADLLDLESSYALKLPEGERILDGSSWSFGAKYEKRDVSSRGRNAWPISSKGLHAIHDLLNKTAQQHDNDK